MSLPFDATLKELVQSHPDDWLTQFGLAGPEPVALLNVDLSTVTAATDVVLSVGQPIQSLVDLNLQAGRDATLSRRVLVYNALLHLRLEVPVHSVVVLLRPAADDTALTGLVQYQARQGRGGMDFRFEVIRIWQRPVETILAGGLGTLPLAPLCQLPHGVSPEEALPAVIRRIEERLTREAAPEDAAKLMTAAFVLTGMRLSREAAIQLFQGVSAMKESTTYQYILDEGRAEGEVNALRKILLRQGQKRFGPPDEQTQLAISGTTSLERLERLAEKLLEVSSWQELLQAP